MSTVSQIITFRKGRAFTTRKPVPPAVPAPPAAPAVPGTPSATVTIGGANKSALAGVTYAARVQRAAAVEIDTRPPTPGSEPAEEQGTQPTAAPRPAQSRHPTPAPAPEPAVTSDTD